jgi:hypothetical protein
MTDLTGYVLNALLRGFGRHVQDEVNIGHALSYKYLLVLYTRQKVSLLTVKKERNSMHEEGVTRK